MKTQSKYLRTFAALTSFLGWVSLILQFYLSLNLAIVNGRGIGWGVFVYFGYFTILSNILATLTVTLPLISQNSFLGRSFQKPGVISMVTTAMTIVGIVYALVLRQIWKPEGLQLATDISLHDVMPILILIYWWLTVPKGSVGWKDIPRWTIYPVGYLLYILVRGKITGVYPYPFLEVGKLGLQQVLTNVLGILIGFLSVGLLLVSANKFQIK
jgi:hypothetical protein